MLGQGREIPPRRAQRETRERRDGGRPLIVATCAMLTGCGESAAEAGWTSARDTLPSGTVLVTNVPPAEITPAEAAPTWMLVEELRVGTVEGDGPDAFAYLKGLVRPRWRRLRGPRVAGAGNSASSAPTAPTSRPMAARARDPASSPTRTASCAMGAGGSGSRTRATGACRSSIPRRDFVESFPFTDANFHWIWNGAMVDGRRIYRPWMRGNRRMLRVYDPTMTPVDSLPLRKPRSGRRGIRSVEPARSLLPGDRRRRVHDVQHPLLSARGPPLGPRGAFWTTRGGDARYRLKLWYPGGDTTLVVETRRPPVPVPVVERDSVIDMMREMLRNMGVGEWGLVPRAHDEARRRGHLRVGRGQPVGPHPVRRRRRPLRRLLGGRHPSRHGHAPASDLALSEQVPPVVRGDAMWLVATDDLDVPYVVRARLAPPATVG